MKNKDDILLKQFFDQHKQQIADNGFSEKVMQCIPQQQSARPYIIWQIVCICFVLFGKICLPISCRILFLSTLVACRH